MEQLPEIPGEAVPIAGAVWILVGILKPLLYRARLTHGFISDISPILAIIMNTVAMRMYIHDDWSAALLTGAVATIVSAGLHSIHDHYTTRSQKALDVDNGKQL